MDAKHIENTMDGKAPVKKCIGGHRHQFALNIEPDGAYCHWKEFGTYDRGSFERISDDDQRLKLENGDRVKLEFRNGRCTAYLNDKLLGEMNKDVPDSFYFAISPFFPPAVYTNSRFE